ncbi:FMN-dependent NADH-azoreductase [Pseudomonas brassicacearum]|uniref:FMN-dependent NADH-azoreductase n=1 Tax=Pseudomonas brassicacearum TaxID=930166 RepID=UPI001DE7DFF3|nr:NAD(P)H-dependent oxidoreductase [Pseudomonas brassicacearum]CAH0157220.1 FMN-dependent NADH-azoreductase 1 [Pseudomonas brassicacearum]
MKLLHIDSSILGANSSSRQITAEVVAEWRRVHPNTEVDYLDLAADTPDHFDKDALGIKVGHPTEPSAAQQRQNAASERLLTQFLESDVLVIGAPLYNFGIPSQLKVWIDRLAQPGRTFSYTANGPVGLAGGKTLIVVSARGGKYPEDGVLVPQERTYMRQMFGFMGITDIRFVRADGLSMGDASREAAFVQARDDIKAVVAATGADATGSSKSSTSSPAGTAA